MSSRKPGIDTLGPVGATVLHPVSDKFYGDRSVQLKDPFGHLWSFATHIEDVPEDELRRRAEACMAEHAK